MDFTKVVSSDPLDKLKRILPFLTSIPLQSEISVGSIHTQPLRIKGPAGEKGGVSCANMEAFVEHEGSKRSAKSEDRRQKEKPLENLDLINLNYHKISMKKKGFHVLRTSPSAPCVSVGAIIYILDE